MNLDEDLSNGYVEKRTRKGSIYYENAKGEMVARICSKCNELKNVFSDFSKSKSGVGGYTSKCRSCVADYRKNNADKIKEYWHNWETKNKERRAEYLRNYSKENREEIYKRNEQWRKENPEKVREAARRNSKRYYRNNKDAILETRRVHYSLNKEDSLEKQKHWASKNPDKIKEYRRNHEEKHAEKRKEYRQRYWKVNRDKAIMHMHRRRARKMFLPDTLSPKDIDTILKHFNNKCALTQSTDGIELDHVLPISVGHGGTIIENIIPLRKDINTSKYNNNIFEWFDANYQRLNLEKSRFDTLIDYLAEINKMTVEEYRDYVYWCHDNPREIIELEESE